MPANVSNSAASKPRRAVASVQLKSVLVATDFSPVSDKAVGYGAALARRYGARFYLMNVVSSLGFTIVGPESLAAATGLASRDAKSLEAQLVRDGTLAGIDHEFIVSSGEVWPELQSVIDSKQIELLVVGTHSRQGLGRLVLGSVAEQIFRHASCPVLTVGPNNPSRAETVIDASNRPILFATDFSNESLSALPYAVSYANRRNTQLVLLHVLSPVPHVDGSRWYTAEDVTDMRKQAIEDAQRHLRELVTPNELAVEPLCIARFGTPSECVVGSAEQFNSVGIVLGLKPRGEAISHLPWSTAYQIVCSAKCPVLTVRQ
ncbi:MAG: universal stress protein [Acidobacteriaceae bacterium]